MFSGFRESNKFENRSIYDEGKACEVKAYKKCASFLGHPVCYMHPILSSSRDQSAQLNSIQLPVEMYQLSRGDLINTLFFNKAMTARSCLTEGQSVSCATNIIGSTSVVQPRLRHTMFGTCFRRSVSDASFLTANPPEKSPPNLLIINAIPTDESKCQLCSECNLNVGFMRVAGFRQDG